jgi:hypothetical protein
MPRSDLQHVLIMPGSLRLSVPLPPQKLLADEPQDCPAILQLCQPVDLATLGLPY